MKTYHKYNFFKHTFCEFTRCDHEVLKNKEIHYTSKKGSKYHYTDEGVYRYANHWGRVANCRWKLVKTEDYKNQHYVVGYAKWTDFFSLHENEKSFYLSVDFNSNKVEIHHIKHNKNQDLFLFTLTEAIKRKKEITQLLTTQKWAKYFETDLSILRKKMVLALISSHQSLLKIKQQLK